MPPAPKPPPPRTKRPARSSEPRLPTARQQATAAAAEVEAAPHADRRRPARKPTRSRRRRGRSTRSDAKADAKADDGKSEKADADKVSVGADDEEISATPANAPAVRWGHSRCAIKSRLRPPTDAAGGSPHAKPPTRDHRERRQGAVRRSATTADAAAAPASNAGLGPLASFAGKAPRRADVCGLCTRGGAQRASGRPSDSKSQAEGGWAIGTSANAAVVRLAYALASPNVHRAVPVARQRVGGRRDPAHDLVEHRLGVADPQVLRAGDADHLGLRDRARTCSRASAGRR